jgi:predicted alpha/beta superfamily hydrolase
MVGWKSGIRRKALNASRIRSACLLLGSAVLAACSGNSDVRKVPDSTTGRPSSLVINSAQTGAAYPLGIYVPPSYARGTRTYPVIYVTDGDAGFPPDGRFMNFERILERRGIDAILVGIGGTARRKKDYLLPGAVAYHAFITQELIPFVEANFRADPKRRILSGISFGGSFVVTCLFLEAQKTLYFSYFISADGSFWQPSFLAQEQQFSSAIGSQSIPATLILARAAPGSAQEPQFFGSSANKLNYGAAAMASDYTNQRTNSAEVKSLYERMADRHYTDLVLIETHFATGHIGTDNPSFEDAMERIFK